MAPEGFNAAKVLRGSTLTHGLVPCVTGMRVFFQGRVGSKPTARPISTSNYSLLRGIDTKFFYLQIIQNLYSPMDKAPGQRPPCPALELNPGLGFFRFFTFLFFHGTPIGVRVLAWVFDFNVYWPWICSRRMHVFSKHVFSKHVFSKHVFSKHVFSKHVFSKHVFSKHVFSKHVFSKHVFSKHVFSKHVFSKHVFSKHVFFLGDGIIQIRFIDTKVVYNILDRKGL